MAAGPLGGNSCHQGEAVSRSSDETSIRWTQHARQVSALFGSFVNHWRVGNFNRWYLKLFLYVRHWLWSPSTTSSAGDNDPAEEKRQDNKYGSDGRHGPLSVLWIEDCQCLTPRERLRHFCLVLFPVIPDRRTSLAPSLLLRQLQRCRDNLPKMHDSQNQNLGQLLLIFSTPFALLHPHLFYLSLRIYWLYPVYIGFIINWTLLCYTCKFRYIFTNGLIGRRKQSVPSYLLILILKRGETTRRRSSLEQGILLQGGQWPSQSTPLQSETILH